MTFSTKIRGVSLLNSFRPPDKSVVSGQSQKPFFRLVCGNLPLFNDFGYIISISSISFRKYISVSRFFKVKDSP